MRYTLKTLFSLVWLATSLMCGGCLDFQKAVIHPASAHDEEASVDSVTASPSEEEVAGGGPVAPEEPGVPVALAERGQYADLIDAYLEGLKPGLKQVYPDQLLALQSVEGASEDDMAALLAVYPECPPAFLALLDRVDGTCEREYQGNAVNVYLLGSDVDEGRYPYCFLAASQMIERRWHSLGDINSLHRNGVQVDPQIDPSQPLARRLHFADCMNNGLISRLYLDFAPSAEGTSGQVIRYEADPDNYAVLADSFETYLKGLMDEGYEFVSQD